MKKILLSLLMLLGLGCASAYAQYVPVNCATSIACTTSGPTNTGTGDPFYVAFGKENSQHQQLFNMFGPSSHLATAGSTLASDIVGLFTGCSGIQYLGADEACHNAGIGGVTSVGLTAFAGITVTGSPITSSGSFTLSTALAGLLKGTGSGFATALSSDVISLWTGTCNNTTYLRADGQCQTPPGTGGGTVNSVSLTMPAGFTVGGSPVTSTGTLAVSTTLSGLLKGNGSGFTTGASADVIALFSTCSGVQYLGADGACHNAAGSGTVTSVAATVPAFLSISGSPVTTAGTLAIGLSGTALPQANGGTGATSLAAASIPVISGLPTTTHCVNWASATTLGDTGATCAGTPAFSAVTAGTNTAALVVGTGGSLTPSGTGTINANQVNGGAVPSSAALIATNGSSQPTAVTVGTGLTVNTGVLSPSAVINAQTGPTYTYLVTDGNKLVTHSNAASIAATLPVATTTGFGVGFGFTVQNIGVGTLTITPTTSTINGATTLVVAQNQGCDITSDGTNYQVSACSAVGGGGGSSAFSSLTSGTNTTAAMVVGTGASIGATGSGAITATAMSAAGLTGTIAAGRMPAITGDVTSTSGTVATTVVQVEGAAIPTSAVVVGTNSSKQLVSTPTVSYLIDGGATFTAAGTGACATRSTLVGGTSVGRLTCTGTTGISTLTITLPTATNGWRCQADDMTTANVIRQTSTTTTTCVLSATIITANDVVTFLAMGY